MNKCEWCGNELDTNDKFHCVKGVCNEDCLIDLKLNETKKEGKN
jgi:hypothetical protein